MKNIIFCLTIVALLAAAIESRGQSVPAKLQGHQGTRTANANNEFGTPKPASSLKPIDAKGWSNTTTIPRVPPYNESISSQVGQLSVDWVTPKSIILGRAAEVELVVRNRGPIAVNQIAIEPILPEGCELVQSTPAFENTAAGSLWKIDELGPQSECRILLKMIFSVAGNTQTDAKITYSTTTEQKLQVVEPKLAIVVDSPTEALVGNQMFFNVTVSNPGTGPTSNTQLDVQFPQGIAKMTTGTKYDIGVLNPGESRSIRVPGHIAELGQHACKFIASADYDLRKETSRSVDGLGPQIEFSISGPKLRYVNRPATYTLTIANNGSAAANDLAIRCGVPRPFVFVTADHSGNFDAVNKNINWQLEKLAPGEKQTVKFDLKAATPGNVPILAEAIGQRGLRVVDEHVTEVKGIAAILVEVVDVVDPIEVGVDTFYEIIVTNQGTEFAKEVSIKAEVPKEMMITGSQGPSKGIVEGQTIQFEILEKLAPRADAIYRLKVRGVEAKDVRIKVTVDAESLDSPVLELESTKVYKD